MFDLRLRKLRHFLKEKKLDVLLISNFYSILYLTGFKTAAPEEREASVVVTRRNVYLITDGRYISKEGKKDGITYKVITPEKRLLQHLQEIVQEEKIKRLSFEMEDLKFEEYELLKKKLGVKLIPVDGAVLKLRAIKEKEEINKIKRTCTVADQCLREIIKTVKVGQTEREIAFKIEYWLKQKGHDISFTPIVAVGANAAVPHYNTQTGNGKVKKGSILLIDYGVRFGDYCSDTTRTFFIGKPQDGLMNVYQKLLSAQEKTIRHINKVKKLKDIDSFCRKELEKSGLSNFSHSTGHGVGLEVHEAPSISPRSKDSREPNQIFTIEPGIYIPGKYGMRIEDMVWIKKDTIEVLTAYPKDPKSLICSI